MRSVSSGQLLGMLHRAIFPATRPNPVLLVWHWRYELALFTALLFAPIGMIKTLGLNGAILFTVSAMTIMLALLIGWPAARYRLAARVWCIVTQHRLRSACVQARIHTRRGRLPVILWCAPREYGEQVLIWCLAGVTADDFAAARQVLATACYAADVEVATHPRYRHLVILKVIRYRPSDLQPPDEVTIQLSQLSGDLDR